MGRSWGVSTPCQSLHADTSGAQQGVEGLPTMWHQEFASSTFIAQRVSEERRANKKVGVTCK